MTQHRSRNVRLLLALSLVVGCAGSSATAAPATTPEAVAAAPAAPASSAPAPASTAANSGATPAWTSVENPHARYIVALGEPTAHDDSVEQDHLDYARLLAARTLQSYADVEVAPPHFDRAALVAEGKRRNLLGVFFQCGVTLHDVDAQGTHFAVNVAVVDMRTEDIVATLSGRATAPGPTSDEAEQEALEGALNVAMRGVPQLLDSLAKTEI